ncbi:hypothetical protein [Pedobacter sp. MC2016-24]|uniref:hypothetical protein n=1 Tax=Pedobacter sp. MC2016-24 TaxID=2780090 RepID=UPI001882C0EE|nr:hypothetical protein [Pedobacter sp. MC2016-24]MBE9599384.1 hypothetical protein [Pedobacter sp. MC2016-24]
MQMIRYNRSQFKGSYFTGLLWLVLGLIMLFGSPELTWRHVLCLVVGSVYALLLLFDREKNYILIDEDKIVVKRFFNKKIKINQIKDISYETDFIIISTNRKQVKIILNLIHPKDLGMAIPLNY